MSLYAIEFSPGLGEAYADFVVSIKLVSQPMPLGVLGIILYALTPHSGGFSDNAFSYCIIPNNPRGGVTGNEMGDMVASN
jgi:hypothetical protein